MVIEMLGLFSFLPFMAMIKLGIKNRSLSLLPFCFVLALTYLGCFLILAFQPIISYPVLCALMTCFAAHVMYGSFITKKMAGFELEMHDFLIYPVFIGVGLYASIQPLINIPVSYLIVITLLGCFSVFMFLQIRRFGQKISGDNLKARYFWKVYLLELGLLFFIVASRIISELFLFWEIFIAVSALQFLYGILLWK